MSDLGADARAVLDSARDGLSPTPNDHARIRLAIDSAVAPSQSRIFAGKYVGRLLIGVALMCFVGAGIYVASTKRLMPTTPRTYTKTASEPPRLDVEQETPAPIAIPNRAAPSSPPRRARNISRSDAAQRTAQSGHVDPVDLLHEELRVLAIARAAIHRGDFVAARNAVDDHAARFPTGVFIEEREAARTRIRCQSESPEDALKAGRAFIERYPHSAMRASVETVCHLTPESSHLSQ